MTEQIYCNIYRRVSSKKQEQGLSLEAQESLLRNWASQNNYLIIGDFKATESAKEEGRLVFNRMIKHCIENNIKNILVEKTDRLQRSKKDEVFIEDLIKKHNLKFYLVKENRVISKNGSSSDALISDVQGMIARHEIRVLKERVGKGLKAKVEKNELPCQAPIGYRNIPRSKTSPGKCIQSENFNKVKKLFLTFLEGGRSVREMEKVAESFGLKSKRGNVLTKPTISWMLRNPFYYGEFTYAGKLYKNETQGFIPMITKKQYEKIQKILSCNCINTVGTTAKTKWKFKNFVHCAKCGRLFLAEQTIINHKHKKKGKLTGKITTHKYIQYHCTKGDYFVDEKTNLVAREYVKQDGSENYYYEKNSKILYLTKKKCDTGCIREEELGRLLTQEFDALKFNKVKWNKIKSNLLKNEKHSRKLIAEELKILRSEYSKNRTIQDTLYDDKINEVITEDFFKQKMKKIDNRQFEVTGRIEELEDDEKFYDNKVEQVLKAIDNVNNFKGKFIEATPLIKKQMVDMMCSKIYLMGGEKIPDTQKKLPYELYVEWNDEFNDLYEAGLIEMAEESKSKYGLPKKVNINITNSKNNI